MYRLHQVDTNLKTLHNTVKVDAKHSYTLRCMRLLYGCFFMTYQFVIVYSLCTYVLSVCDVAVPV